MPLTISAKVALASSEDTRKYAMMLAGEAPPELEPTLNGEDS